MGSDPIKKSIDTVNRFLSSFEHMGCVAVWRSVGSNVFFEFGTPTIKRVTPKTRKPFTVVRGEAAIGVHADNWCLNVGRSKILTSDTVDDGNLSDVAKRLLLGTPMPKFELDSCGILVLTFVRLISLRIHRNDYLTVSDDIYDEITVNFPDTGFSFNYRRGFYEVASK